MFDHVDESYDDNKCVGVCVTLFLFKLVFPFREKLRLKLKSQPGRHSRKLLVLASDSIRVIVNIGEE